jgi:hypothetical protein
VVPRTISTAIYTAARDSEDGFIAGVAGYSSGSNVWTAMQALRTLQAFLPPGLPSRDVQIEILYCGVCHSDLHFARNEWGIHPVSRRARPRDRRPRHAVGAR